MQPNGPVPCLKPSLKPILLKADFPYPQVSPNDGKVAFESHWCWATALFWRLSGLNCRWPSPSHWLSFYRWWEVRAKPPARGWRSDNVSLHGYNPNRSGTSLVNAGPIKQSKDQTCPGSLLISCITSSALHHSIPLNTQLFFFVSFLFSIRKANIDFNLVYFKTAFSPPWFSCGGYNDKDYLLLKTF